MYDILVFLSLMIKLFLSNDFSMPTSTIFGEGNTVRLNYCLTSPYHLYKYFSFLRSGSDGCNIQDTVYKYENSLGQWSSTQPNKAHKPAGFSVLPGGCLLSPSSIHSSSFPPSIENYNI